MVGFFFKTLSFGFQTDLGYSSSKKKIILHYCEDLKPIFKSYKNKLKKKILNLTKLKVKISLLIT